MSNVIALPVLSDGHRETEARWITRLGGKEYLVRCSCGITTTHPQPGHARLAYFAYHEIITEVQPGGDA